MSTNSVANKNNESFDAIKEAHHLSYNAPQIEKYYDTWSDNYDQDVSNEEYKGPEFIAEYLEKMLTKKLNIDPSDKSFSILDAGCGTGLVGLALHNKGFVRIDGFDLSHQMVEQAKKTNAYKSLTGGCDMNGTIDSYQNDQYDVTICCGVFTLGHVAPTALEELIRITKPGGLMIISTRKSYYDTTDYQAVCDRLQAEDKVILIDSIMDGSYIAEEGAHYWAFVVN